MDNQHNQDFGLLDNMDNQWIIRQVLSGWKLIFGVYTQRRWRIFFLACLGPQAIFLVSRAPLAIYFWCVQRRWRYFSRVYSAAGYFYFKWQCRAPHAIFFWCIQHRWRCFFWCIQRRRIFFGVYSSARYLFLDSAAGEIFFWANKPIQISVIRIPDFWTIWMISG